MFRPCKWAIRLFTELVRRLYNRCGDIWGTRSRLAAYTNPTIYDVRRDLIPHISPHQLYSLLTSSMDNLMMAHLQDRNMQLYLTYRSCLILLCLLTVCIYSYIDAICFVLVVLSNLGWNTNYSDFQWLPWTLQSNSRLFA